MELISVSGACSRAGKTACAVTILRELAPAAAAVKFTTTAVVFKRCPRGTPCVVCDIPVPFRIVDDPEVLHEAGTDTQLLAEAGSGRVLWAISKTSAAPQAWRAVERRIDGEAAVVIEGSTIVELARPAMLLFVVHPFLSPAPAGERRAPAVAVMDEIRRHRGRDDARLADVTRPLAEWAPDLAARLPRSPAPASATMRGRSSVAAFPSPNVGTDRLGGRE
jgi:hypothetical protein